MTDLMRDANVNYINTADLEHLVARQELSAKL